MLFCFDLTQCYSINWFPRVTVIIIMINKFLIQISDAWIECAILTSHSDFFTQHRSNSHNTFIWSGFLHQLKKKIVNISLNEWMTSVCPFLLCMLKCSEKLNLVKMDRHGRNRLFMENIESNWRMEIDLLAPRILHRELQIAEYGSHYLCFGPTLRTEQQ